MRTARKPVILVADDEPGLVRLMQFNLEMEGYRVLTARNGEEALETARAHHPDLIILDVMMPKLDGFEVLKRLREESQTESIPVIMLTALSHERSISQGWELGADFYLTKPFDPSELLEVVRRFLEAEGSQ